METQDEFAPPTHMIVSTRRDPRFAALLDRVERGEKLDYAAEIPEGVRLSSNGRRRLEEARRAYEYAYPVDGHEITREDVKAIHRNSHDTVEVVVLRQQWWGNKLRDSDIGTHLMDDCSDLGRAPLGYCKPEHKKGWRKKSQALNFDNCSEYRHIEFANNKGWSLYLLYLHGIT